MRSTSKSSGVMRTGVPDPPRVIAFLSVSRDVEVERVAELVGLVVVRALVPEAGALDLVAPGPVLQQPAEEVAERPLADAPDALRA